MFENRLSYIRALFAPESQALQNARASITDANDGIIIHPEEGKLLQLLIRMNGVKNIVEIGTLAGYSALWMAEALPPDGRIITIEKDETRAALARRNIAHEPRIELVTGDALQVLQQLKGPFDMVFIDADKINYTAYLDWAEVNVRQGGLIVGDNTFLFDAVWKDGPVDRVRETARAAMRDFNARLADAEKYHSILLPTEEGLTIAVRKQT
jgi:predicted O-methyltransferase YrrM